MARLRIYTPHCLYSDKQNSTFRDGFLMTHNRLIKLVTKWIIWRIVLMRLEARNIHAGKYRSGSTRWSRIGSRVDVVRTQNFYTTNIFSSKFTKSVELAHSLGGAKYLIINWMRIARMVVSSKSPPRDGLTTALGDGLKLQGPENQPDHSTVHHNIDKSIQLIIFKFPRELSKLLKI